ncbi:MAG TPA: D-glycero-beta-D-manno-heptose-7-phosphate kinase [Nitrospirae bacterium]|nr:D-glycero-beta-D-manno-heptose-7-phosphate kinase [Nitrospirota bacterium]
MDLKRVLNNFKKKRILVVGDIILDHYIWGLVDRISPEAPVPVVDVKEENYNLGGAANVAANIVSLGGRATVLGIRGNDIHGEVLEDLMRERGIDTSGIFTGSRPTTVKTRVIAHNQQVVRFDREERRSVDGSRFKKISDFLLSSRDKWDAIIVSDYKKGMVTRRIMRLLVSEFKSRGAYLAVDPKVGNFPMYRDVSIITPNLKEASQGSGIEIKDEQSLIKAGTVLLRRLRCDSILITRGEQGMSLFDGEGVTHIPTAARSVYDVTGAGDTVIAAFTLAHVAGAGLRDAAMVANHAAGIVVGKIGTACATKEELKEALKNA